MAAYPLGLPVWSVDGLVCGRPDLGRWIYIALGLFAGARCVHVCGVRVQDRVRARSLHVDGVSYV